MNIIEMLEYLNASLPFAGHLSVSIVKNYIKELEKKLENFNIDNEGENN